MDPSPAGAGRGRFPCGEAPVQVIGLSIVPILAPKPGGGARVFSPFAVYRGRIVKLTACRLLTLPLPGFLMNLLGSLMHGALLWTKDPITAIRLPTKLMAVHPC